MLRELCAACVERMHPTPLTGYCLVSLCDGCHAVTEVAVVKLNPEHQRSLALELEETHGSTPTETR
jgi:hypothetical protein